KSAFRKLAKEHHPDRNPGDKAAEQKFKELNEAYEALKDPQKRAAYDQFGHAAFEGGRGPGGSGFGPDFASSMSDIFDDLFGEFMGGRRGGRSRSGRERGADIRYNMEITLGEAFTGKQATIKVPTTVGCETCSGTGAKPGTRPSPCPTCQGQGKVRASQGFFTIERVCPSCQGRGEIIEDPCSSCHGAGRVTKERTLQVSIPSGVEDGTRIRLAGEGEAGQRGGPTGDLYIFLSIKPHEFFQRDGADVFCRVPIAMTTAALGGSIDVPLLDNSRVAVSVPAGTETGKQFRIKSKGMPVLRSNVRGDMYIQVEVETPKNLTKRQRELLQEFEKESHKGTSPESSGFFSRIRELFEGKGG
ncbi:MAG: molecular chaperone DnaJ, partial [Hyphomicrobiaceae bacterium]